MKKKGLLVLLLTLVIGGIFTGCQKQEGEVHDGEWEFYASSAVSPS